MNAFTMFPKTSVAMMATASRHAQRRRLNQAVPATAIVAPSKSRGIPNVFPNGASCLYARALIAHMWSRMVPRQISVAPASEAMVAPKKRKMPIAVIPMCDFFWTNISNSRRGAMHQDWYSVLSELLFRRAMELEVRDEAETCGEAVGARAQRRDEHRVENGCFAPPGLP